LLASYNLKHMTDPDNQPVQICELLLRAERTWPDKPAITFAGKTQSWVETATRCKQSAALLQREGVGNGDRVGFLGLNSAVFFECYYSPALIGAILVPVNYRLSVREMIECVEDSQPSVLIVDEHFVEQARAIREACPGIRSLIFCGSTITPQGMISYEQSIAELQVTELTPSQDNETVIVFYTGGTTGRSKGVMLSNINFKANTDCSVPLYRMQEGWCFVIAGPMFHLSAGSRVFSCTALGGHCVILPRFDVRQLLQCIATYRINSMTLVPTMLRMMLDHPDFSTFDLSSLKMIAYGAAPMPLALLRKVIAAFPSTEIFQTFGMTETSPIVTSMDSQYHVLDRPDFGRLASVGRTVPHVEVIVADEDDDKLPAGETGQILVRGKNVMTGYWRKPDLTAEALKGGWYHTGDAGYFDDDGFLFLEGRIKDMIVTGGENVYPIEAENVLSGHAAVRQCAVIGIPHATWGEAVHGIVILEEEAQAGESELIDFCREQLAHYKCPVGMTFRTEPMPLSPINKILKTELRKPFWEGRGTRN